MKKTKILAVLGACLALGISACTPSSGSQPGDKSNPSQQSDDAHKHSFGKWTQTVAPTCTTVGSEERVCECGEKETREVKALGHDFDNGTVVSDTATCTVDGKLTLKCARCDATKEVDSKAHHDFGAASEVAAGADPADQVGYTLANCSKGDAIQVDIKAVDAKFYKGGIKSGTPEGYFKLNSKNDKAYWKFTLAGSKMYKGMLYQRGAMDSFSSNTTKSYASTSTSGDNAPEYTKGNFDCVVNGDSLDKTEWIRTTFEELLADGDDSSAMGDNYSPLCLCPIGEAVLQPGLNEITYERLGSYNLIISDLIFIGSEFEHTHAPATDWSNDDAQHWHACTAPGCPTGKLDVANHTFGEWVENKAATCSEAGERQHTCSICNKVVKEEIAKVAHTLGDAYDVKSSTCEAAGSQKRKCSVCNEVIEEVLPKIDHTFGDAVANNAAGEGYIATTAHNCSTCNKSALRWSAKNFDATLSSTELEVNDDNIRFKSGSAENKGGTEGAGTHIVYKINVAAAQEKAGLAFYIQNTGGSGSGSANISPVFGMIAGDGTVGAIKQADGTFKTATHRYGIKVNDVEYFLGDDYYGNQNKTKGWFEWPVEFPLKAGVNTIDIFPYAGYRANLYEFELTGLPHVESTHTHTLSDWQSDDNNHWKVCSGEGCPSAAGTHLEEATHTFVKDVSASSDATTTAKGLLVEKCSVCEKIRQTVLPVLSLKEWVKEDLTAAIPNHASLTSTTYANGIIGYKFNSATNAIATFTYTSATAGTFNLRLLLSPKDGNQGSTGFWKYNGNAKSKITVNGTELAAPANDVDMSVCTVKSETAKDGTSVMREPLWFDMPNIELVAGENTIVVQFLAGSYSYFLCGAAIANIVE